MLQGAPVASPAPRRSLFADAEQGFGGRHDRYVLMAQTVVLHFGYVTLQDIDIEHGVATLAVVVAAEPIGDVVGHGNRVVQEFLAGDLGYVDRHLRAGGGRCHKTENETEQQSGYNRL